MNHQLKSETTIALSGIEIGYGSTVSSCVPSEARDAAPSQCRQCERWFIFAKPYHSHGFGCCHERDIAADTPPRRERIAMALRNLRQEIADTELYRALFR